MKVTRLKNGHKIKMNDSEFALLQAAAAQLDPKRLFGDAKGAYTKRIAGGDLLRVDDDQRSNPSSNRTGRPGFGSSAPLHA